MDCTHGNEVQNTQHHRKDPRRDDDPPKWEAQSLLACSWRVQIAQNSHTQYNHRQRKSDKARLLTQEWPIVVEVASKNGEFRDDEKN